MLLKKFFYIFIFASILFTDNFAQIEQNIWGYIRFNNSAYQGATVKVRNQWIDGSYDYSNPGISQSNGFYVINLQGFDYSTPVGTNGLISRNVTIYYPLSCPYDPFTGVRNFVGINLEHSYNYVASPPSGNGTVSGTVYVNGSPAPYHTTIKHYLPNGTYQGYAQTYNNNGTYSFPVASTYGTHRLEITVYTQPNVTTQNFYFCLNQPNEVFNPNLSISGFQTGYMVGNVRYNCTNLVNNIVYFTPTTPNGMAQGYVVTNSLGNYTSYNLPVGTYNFWTTYNGVTLTYTRTLQAGANSLNFRFGSIACEDDIKVDKSSNNNDETLLIPKEYELNQNYPNPFNPTTSISYSLKNNSYVKLTIFDVMGKVVKVLVDEFESAGYKNLEWDGTNENHVNVPSGTYFYRLEANGNEFVKTNKMILLK